MRTPHLNDAGLGRLRSLVGNNLLGALALVVACSGTAYAAARIGSADIIDNSVQSVDVKDKTLKQRDLAPALWRDVRAPTKEANCATGQTGTFCANGDASHFTNYGEGFQDARYRKDATGQVSVEGLIRHYYGGSIPQHEIFVLPKGYRPAASLIFPVACGGPFEPYDRAGAVQVDRNGMIKWRQMDACEAEQYWVSLTGISFPAA